MISTGPLSVITLSPMFYFSSTRRRAMHDSHKNLLFRDVCILGGNEFEVIL